MKQREEIEKLSNEIEVAKNVLQMAIKSGNEDFIVKTKIGLFKLQQKMDLLQRSISLEDYSSSDLPQTFKLNIK